MTVCQEDLDGSVERDFRSDEALSHGLTLSYEYLCRGMWYFVSSMIGSVPYRQIQFCYAG